MTTQRIAELEAEVLRLRSVMADVIKAHGYAGGTPIEALSTPFTHTALNELIEKVEKRTIERCATVIGSIYYNHIGEQFGEVRYGIHYCSEAIRALPVGQIKLSELFK